MIFMSILLALSTSISLCVSTASLNYDSYSDQPPPSSLYNQPPPQPPAQQGGYYRYPTNNNNDNNNQPPPSYYPPQPPSQQPQPNYGGYQQPMVPLGTANGYDQDMAWPGGGGGAKDNRPPPYNARPDASMRRTYNSRHYLPQQQPPSWNRPGMRNPPYMYHPQHHHMLAGIDSEVPGINEPSFLDTPSIGRGLRLVRCRGQTFVTSEDEASQIACCGAQAYNFKRVSCVNGEVVINENVTKDEHSSVQRPISENDQTTVRPDGRNEMTAKKTTRTTTLKSTTTTSEKTSSTTKEPAHRMPPAEEILNWLLSSAMEGDSEEAEDYMEQLMAFRAQMQQQKQRRRQQQQQQHLISPFGRNPAGSVNSGIEPLPMGNNYNKPIANENYVPNYLPPQRPFQPPSPATGFQPPTGTGSYQQRLPTGDYPNYPRQPTYNQRQQQYPPPTQQRFSPQPQYGVNQLPQNRFNLPTNQNRYPPLRDHERPPTPPLRTPPFKQQQTMPPPSPPFQQTNQRQFNYQQMPVFNNNNNIKPQQATFQQPTNFPKPPETASAYSLPRVQLSQQPQQTGQVANANTFRAPAPPQYPIVPPKRQQRPQTAFQPTNVNQPSFLPGSQGVPPQRPGLLTPTYQPSDRLQQPPQTLASLATENTDSNNKNNNKQQQKVNGMFDAVAALNAPPMNKKEFPLMPVQQGQEKSGFLEITVPTSKMKSAPLVPSDAMVRQPSPPIAKPNEHHFRLTPITENENQHQVPFSGKAESPLVPVSRHEQPDWHIEPQIKKENDEPLGVYTFRCGTRSWQTRENMDNCVCCGDTLLDIRHSGCGGRTSQPLFVSYRPDAVFHDPLGLGIVEVADSNNSSARRFQKRVSESPFVEAPYQGGTQPQPARLAPSSVLQPVGNLNDMPYDLKPRSSRHYRPRSSNALSSKQFLVPIGAAGTLTEESNNNNINRQMLKCGSRQPVYYNPETQFCCGEFVYDTAPGQACSDANDIIAKY